MKRIFCTLCAMTLLLYGVMTTAFATAVPSETPQGAEGDSTASPATEGVAEAPIPTPDPVPLYPAEVKQSEENGVTRIEKIYYLSAQDDPSNIPTEDFEREGKVYTLLDVLKQAQIESDTQDYVEVLTLDSDTQDMEKILAMLEPELEVQTEDGYQGVLSLDHTTITVEAAGYKSSSRTVSATRTYYAVEIEAPEGYKLDDTPHYFEVVDGKTSKLTVTNKAFSGILIHKTDSSTGKGIYGVTFLLYDANNNPVGQYTSDNQGYVYIENIETGRYYLRELENEGYILDTQRKTVYVKSGETTLVEWENTPIMGQIQIIKKSADDNPINALPAGTLLEGAVFEVYDKAGNVVDTIVSDYNGRAVSKLLPLGRYTIREVQAPDYYSINPTVLTAYLDYEGQIVTFEVEDNSVSTGVSIKKTGYAEVMPNQPIRYTITGIGNTSTVPLSSFYWRDTLPGQVQLSKVVTGTYNQQLSYKIVYKTNLKDSYQTLADSLSTTKNYVLEASPAALGLASNERVTEIMFVFGTVKGGFGQVETAYIHGNVVNGLANGSSIVNVADVGGVYNGQWIQAVSRWVTKVYAKTITTLPKTGY